LLDLNFFQYKKNFMDEFKEWMYKVKNIPHTIYDSLDYQMLIGYMEEFLLVSKGLFIGISDKICLRIHNGEKYSTIRYEELKEKIIMLPFKR